MPSFDGGDDFVWIGGPGEGLWVVVGLVEEAVDGDLEVDNGAEDAAFQAPLRELRKEALEGIEPGAGGRHEVEGEALVAAEPGAHLGMLVGGVVVEDHMDALAGRDIGLNGVEEADELLVAVALHAAPDDLAPSTLRAANRVVVPCRL